jgi:hypothetical protein
MQKGQRSALGAVVRERVVEVIQRRSQRREPRAPAQEPQLFEVPDVNEIPGERRLQRRVLARQLFDGKSSQERFRAQPGVRERLRELSR